MSERKVLNKYYPPDFDPTKIPKIKRPKNFKRGTFCIRLMAPFNMRCNTCGEYIYKGKKFNSRKETVENENYLGLHIFRFYIKCPQCIAEIAFKTDPESTDYVLEAGATRNFEAARTAEKMALAEQKEKEAEDASNPMKVLENRTKASCQEMEMLETLEELRELRHRHAKADPELMIQQAQEESKKLLQKQEEEDEDFVRSMFGNDGSGIVIKRLNSDSDDDTDDSDQPETKIQRTDTSKPTNILTQETATSSSSASSARPSWSRGTTTTSTKNILSGLVRPKSCAPPQRGVQGPAKSDQVLNATSVTPSSQPVSVPVLQPGGGSASIKTSLTTGLAGLGAYSDTSSSNDEDG